MSFVLKVPKDQIRELSEKYKYPGEDEIERELAPRTRQRGFLDKKDFVRLCYWKSPRNQKRCAANDETFIRDVTSIALSTKSERVRIEILQLLKGVSWPTASVILHFGYDNLYPILDFRALWSISADDVDASKYDFAFWMKYTEFCRMLASEMKVSMRVLDRALWQYSKDNQRD